MAQVLGQVLLLSLLPVCPCASSLLQKSTRDVSLATESHHLDNWFLQKLDHFSENGSSLWQQRYFINDDFYKPGGPVFLMIGGKNPASRSWISKRYTWVAYAKKLDALLLLLEHRFYGRSQPTGDLSTASLHYLSSRQGLADIVNFRTEIAKKMELTQNKWVAFGSFYGGSLAVWSRSKYPNLFAAAVGSSAMIQPKLNFHEYFEVVHRTLDEHKPNCSRAMQEALNIVVERLEHGEDYTTLKDDLLLCEPLQHDSEMHRFFFVENMLSMYVITFENKKDSHNSQETENTISIDDLCGIATNTLLGSPYHKFVTMENLLLMDNNENCLYANYSNFVEFISSSSLTEDSIVGERQWLYQVCTEFGTFPTMDSKLPLRYFLKQCSDAFGLEFNISSVSMAISATNAYYGGFKVNGSKIIFSYGSIDPYHPLGVTENISEELPAIAIKGEARSADLGILKTTDSAAIIEARRDIFQILKEWLNVTDVSEKEM